MPQDHTPLPQEARRLPAGRVLAVILALALGLRLFYSLALFPRLVESKGQELGWIINGRLAVDPYDRIALNILAGKGYVDDTGRLNFERTPLYTYFLVSVFGALGREPWKVQAVQSVLDTLSCLLVFLLARRALRDETAALLAAALYAVYFKMIAEVARPETETLYVLVLLAFLSLFLASLAKTRRALPAGIGLGLLTLCKPITLLFPIIAVIIYLAGTGRARLKKVGLFLLGFLVCVVPLFVRNYHLTGRAFFSTGGGKMLYMGTVIDYTKNFRAEEARLIKDINARYAFPYSVEDDNTLRNMAVRNILRDPWAYAKRVAARVYLFWTYPDSSTRLMAVKGLLVLAFNLVLLVLAAWGILKAGRRGLMVWPFLGLFFYVYLAYALIYAYSRYSLPLFPMIFIFAAYGILGLIRAFGERGKRVPA